MTDRDGDGDGGGGLGDERFFRPGSAAEIRKPLILYSARTGTFRNTVEMYVQCSHISMSNYGRALEPGKRKKLSEDNRAPPMQK